MTDLGMQQPHRTAADVAFAVFLRVVAVACIAAGLRYWAMLIGIYGEPFRFDLIPPHWKLAAASLAVLFPVAGSGLWMMVSWGPVIWLGAAGTEIAMHGFFPQLFGARPLILILHGAVAALYVSFRIVLYMQKRRRRDPVRVDSL